MLDSRPQRHLALAHAAIAVGAVLPWLSPNPFYDGVHPLVYLAGQGSGLETWGMATLPLSLLALVVVAVRERRQATAASALVGAGSAVVALEATIQGMRTPWLLPGPGAALTVLAGVAALALAARIRSNPDD